MGDNAIRRKVDFPLYLEVLKELPEVSEEDIAQTEAVFKAIYGEVPEEVTFDIGTKKGDGEIFAFQRVSDDAGRSVRTKLLINEYGEMNNPETGSSGTMPMNVATYFVSSLFGMKELDEETESLFPCKGGGFINPFYDKCSDDKDDFDPYWDQDCTCYTYVESTLNDLIMPHLGELSKGAWLLYEASLKKGSLGSKASSNGAEMIEGVKVQLMASLHLMTQEVWKDAHKVLNTAKEAYGSAEDIEAAMKPYAEFKPANPPLTYEQATLRYKKSVAMIKDVAKTENGEDKFLDEICTKKTIEEGKTAFNEYEIAEYECGYGVNGGVQRLETIIDPTGGFINPF